MHRPSTLTPRGGTAAVERLPPEHMAWLKEFSVVMHRRNAYPAGHPSRVAADAAAFEAIGRALSRRPEIVIVISRRQLGIGGALSDVNNPALGELAERLHRQGIASITLRAGLTAAEFDDVLTRISATAPAGDDPDELRPSGAHAVIDLLSFDALALSDEDVAEEQDSTGDRLWRELAECALAGGAGRDGEGSGSGGEADGDLTKTTADQLAQAINARAHDAAAARQVLTSMIRVGRHARRRGRAGGGEVAARLRDTLKKLDPGVLRTLLQSETDPARQQKLLLQGVDAMPLSVVLDWVEAAATASDNSISHYLLRLLKKLGSQAHRRRDGGADEGGEALRTAARDLIEGWTHEGRETEQHSALLHAVATHETSGEAIDTADAAGADRIIQMALETDVTGADVTAAMDYMIATRRITTLLGYVEQMPDSMTAAPAIHDYLESPETLRRILLTEPLDEAGTRALLARCWSTHAEALLDALTISESQATRLLILERLRAIADDVRDQIIARLPDAPWYVVRNLLSLLSDMRALPATLDVRAFARHEEPSVRAEAVRLLAQLPDDRDETIHNALADPDLRVVRAALDAAAHGLPRKSGLRVLQALDRAEKGSDLRLVGIGVLEQVRMAAARDWLVQSAVRRRGFFRRLALQPRSPELLAALRVLAAHWRDDAAAAPVFRLAKKSGDIQVVEAVSTRT